MGWSIGFDNNWHRDVGYGVPAICDKPKCNEKIDRGLSYVCGSDMYGGEYGCGLYFCGKHLQYQKPRGADGNVQRCPSCIKGHPTYSAKPDTEEWIKHKLTDESWAEWREENQEQVRVYLLMIKRYEEQRG